MTDPADQMAAEATAIAIEPALVILSRHGLRGLLLSAADEEGCFDTFLVAPLNVNADVLLAGLEATVRALRAAPPPPYAQIGPDGLQPVEGELP